MSNNLSKHIEELTKKKEVTLPELDRKLKFDDEYKEQLKENIEKAKRQLTNKSPYYGELSLSFRAETKQSIEELKNKYDVGGLKIKLVLESHYGEEEITPEVLEIWSAEWEEWDEL